MTLQDRGSILTGLRSKAWEKYSQLFSGFEEITLLDVPDYANPGDSAIFLGLLNFLSSKGIKVTNAFSRGTLSHSAIKNSSCIAFMGGGAFGGLSPESDEVRMFVLETMNPDSTVIQCPQSVHFTSERHKVIIAEAFGAVKNLRLAARDKSSLEILASIGLTAELVPDSSHFLNFETKRNQDFEKVTFLVRQDKESTSFHADSIDNKWNSDSVNLKLARGIRLFGRYSESLAKALNPSLPAWERIAEMRLSRAKNLIYDSSVIVTNRLHGLLISMMAGKSVVFFDNSNGKVSAYRDTWMHDTPGVYRARDLDEATEIAQTLVAKKKI